MKKRLANLAYYSGLLRLAVRARNGDTFFVLMYHHVTEAAAPFIPHVTGKVFRRQIVYLKKNYRVRTLGRIVDRVKRGETLHPRTAAITFDDEYEDIYYNAFPILKEKNIPATVFIATGFVDTDRVPWTDELGFLFAETAKGELELRGKDAITRFHWSDQESKLEALGAVKRALKMLPEESRREVFDRIKDQLEVSKTNPARILNSDQIKKMAEWGMEFGAHTVNHPILTRIPPEAARREIEESKEQLEKLIGAGVRGFCYPNGEIGDYDERIKMMVKKAGYDYACTTLEGENGPGTDLYELKRIWTTEPSFPLFAARLLRQH